MDRDTVFAASERTTSEAVVRADIEDRDDVVRILLTGEPTLFPAGAAGAADIGVTEAFKLDSFSSVSIGTTIDVDFVGLLFE